MKKQVLHVAVVLLSIGFSTSARADFEEGVAAYLKKDYETAFREIEPAARGGNPAAQHALGRLYEEGQGVKQDYSQAVIWYRKAADQKSADAMESLGNLFSDGNGVKRDLVAAVNWLRKSAESGHFLASIRDLRDPKKINDYEDIATEFRKAAEQGNADAQANLGYMYLIGLGVPQGLAAHPHQTRRRHGFSRPRIRAM
jgi:TPR repeat protein